MHRDSVRELKQSLTGSILAPMAAAVTTRRVLHLAAQPGVAAAGTHRTMALGVVTRGTQDDRLAVRGQRRVLESSPQIEPIRTRARAVDVRYVGRSVKRALPWDQRRNRPLRIGGSIGPYNITAGTLGCFVKRRKGGATLILSNNHVLADENRGKAGDVILQPGVDDGGRDPAEAVATLGRFVRLKKAGANVRDCAVARVKSHTTCRSSSITGLGSLVGLGDEILDDGAKGATTGRTTGTTRGRVTAFALDNRIVDFDVGDVRFDNQIEIEGAGDDPFSDGGDSGSLIVDDARRAVALLFAGRDQGGTNGPRWRQPHVLPRRDSIRQASSSQRIRGSGVG